MSKEQRIQELVTQAGILAEELRQEGKDVHLVMIDPASRGETIRGVLTRNVVAAVKPIG